MTWLVLLLLSGTPTVKAAGPRKSAQPVLTPAKAKGHGTQCAACHATSTWSEVRFNHERTGFSLTGAHATTSCKGCHPVDFEQPVARVCSGCHTDVHAGDLGARCEGCHQTTDWRSRVDVDAHRRTNFPLLGGHAALPCVECHVEARERRFSRAMVDCTGCHQVDVQRTVGRAVDHLSTGFGQRPCRECHGAFRFKPARYPGHDGCFTISSGPHAAIGCEGCHTSLAVATVVGACSTRTAACTACHEHACSQAGGATETDRKHQDVPGYQCADRKCYECHQANTGAP